MADVWDPGTDDVRPVIALWEKGAKLRRNAPNDRLRSALRTYVRSMSGGPGDWLFPHRRLAHCVYRDGVRHTVAALCQRAGLSDGITPHSFRRYVVNTAMRAGNRLEAVQKWLGHAHASTTMRHYWTDDLCNRDVLLEPPPEPVVETPLAAAISESMMCVRPAHSLA